MVTRKDLLPEIIEERMLAGEAGRVTAAAEGGHNSADQMRSSTLEKHAVARAQGSQLPVLDYPSVPTQLRPSAQRPGGRVRGSLPHLAGLVEAALQFGAAAAAAAAGSTHAKPPHQSFGSKEAVTLNRRGNRRKRVGENSTVLLVREGSGTGALAGPCAAGIDSGAGGIGGSSGAGGSRKSRLENSLKLIRIVRRGSSTPTPSVEFLSAPMPHSQYGTQEREAECKRPKPDARGSSKRPKPDARGSSVRPGGFR